MEENKLREVIKAAAKEAFREIWQQAKQDMRQDVQDMIVREGTGTMSLTSPRVKGTDRARQSARPESMSSLLSIDGSKQSSVISTSKFLQHQAVLRDNYERRSHAPVLESPEDSDAIRESGNVTATEYPTYTLLRNSNDIQSNEKSIIHQLEALIKSPAFERCIGILVVLNSILMGIETNYVASVPRGTLMPTVLIIAEAGFCFIFTAELTLRLCIYGKSFFTMDGWKWNVLDFVLVVFMILDQSSLLLEFVNMPINFGVVRMLRLLRILRISRALRVFRLFSELNTMVNSMVRSAGSLVSAMALLVLMIYIFGVFFMQLIVGSVDMTKNPDLARWFGSLTDTILTLFECIVGGVGWDRVVQPLMQDISPVMGAVFCIYISGALFAMTNLVTGVFVTNVTTIVREDKDEQLTQMIRDLFLDGNSNITWEVFLSKLDTPGMKAYLKAIDVDPSQAKGLFDLLDEDGGGSLDGDEIVQGFLKLRGPAKSLELSLLCRKVNQMHQELVEQRAIT